MLFLMSTKWKQGVKINELKFEEMVNQVLQIACIKLTFAGYMSYE